MKLKEFVKRRVLSVQKLSKLENNKIVQGSSKKSMVIASCLELTKKYEVIY